MDALHDNSHRTWVQLGNAHEDIIPSYVMEYTAPDKEAASKIVDELFADPARRLFPIDTPASTWLSAAYYHKHANELPFNPAEGAYVKEVIEKAADFHGVTEDVAQIAAAILDAGTEKQASDTDADYGWVMRSTETGEVVGRKYPMFDSRGVEKASEYFDEYRQRYPAGIRRVIARKIMSKAAEYEMDMDKLASSISREAGFGIPRKDILMSELLERAHLTKDAEDAILLANINEMLAGLGDDEISQNLDKIAEVIDAFDRGAGLVKHYGDRILMPADILFDVTLKTAEAALDDAVELDKYVFSLDKLAELSPTVYADVLGPEFGEAITKSGDDIDKEKLSDELFSLPRPDKAALEEHLAILYS